MVPVADAPGDLRAHLLACLRHPTLDPQPLARPAAGLLLRMHPRADADQAARDPLWLLFLARCRNTHGAMEARIAELRRRVLARRDAALDPLAAALALQAFANGYVLPVSPEERETLQSLCSREGGNAESQAPSSTLRRAMYAPLIDLDAPPVDAAAPLVAALVKRTLTDLAEERRLAEAMPSLGEPGRPASRAVRAQYESHPYPRWHAPPPPRRADIRAHLATLPGIDRAALPAAPLMTLVAGCGTGYEAIDLARTDPGLAITALDLSRASLAFAKRNAAELGLARIAFVQGDLLDLDPAAHRYDLITCTGVLHHLADPLAGLRRLAAILAPGGVLRIALYSRRARALVCEAHALIAARGWQGDDGIRSLRAHILALPPGEPLARLAESDDFWSLAGCRDLLFHVLEHQYDLPAIGRMLDAAGLRLVGIDAPDQARALLGRASPLDLGRWDAIEADHPALFAGMYHLWCRRPPTA